MPRILRTERAKVDVIEILVFLRPRNPQMADRFETEFQEKCDLLAKFPLMGRDPNDLAPGLRSSLVKP